MSTSEGFSTSIEGRKTMWLGMFNTITSIELLKYQEFENLS
jgi:hypothetical protein